VQSSSIILIKKKGGPKDKAAYHLPHTRPRRRGNILFIRSSNAFHYLCLKGKALILCVYIYIHVCVGLKHSPPLHYISHSHSKPYTKKEETK